MLQRNGYSKEVIETCIENIEDEKIKNIYSTADDDIINLENCGVYMSDIIAHTENGYILI